MVLGFKALANRIRSWDIHYIYTHIHIVDIYLSIYLSSYLSIYLSIYLYSDDSMNLRYGLAVLLLSLRSCRRLKLHMVSWFLSCA